MIITTTPDNKTAEAIAETLLNKSLAACIQVTNIESYYKWKGENHLDQEKLLLIKTITANYEKIEAEIKANHPYEVPEIIQVPITKGSEEYLGWVGETCRR